jgi:hypothetical protein
LLSACPCLFWVAACMSLFILSCCLHVPVYKVSDELAAPIFHPEYCSPDMITMCRNSNTII